MLQAGPWRSLRTRTRTRSRHPCLKFTPPESCWEPLREQRKAQVSAAACSPACVHQMSLSRQRCHRWAPVLSSADLFPNCSNSPACTPPTKSTPLSPPRPACTHQALQSHRVAPMNPAEGTDSAGHTGVKAPPR